MSGNLYKWVSIPEAQDIVLNAVQPLGKERVEDILACVGYVLAEDVLAKEPLPPFPASIKVQKVFQLLLFVSSVYHLSNQQIIARRNAPTNAGYRMGTLLWPLMVLAPMTWRSRHWQAQQQASSVQARLHTSQQVRLPE